MKMVFICFLLTLGSAKAQEWQEVAREEGIVVYTTDSDSEVMPFRATGTVNKSIDQILKLLKNNQLKPSWSPKLKRVKVHQEIDQNNFIFSEYYKTPWPATDREFLLRGTINSVSDKEIKLSAQSIEREDLKDEDHIQVDVMTLDLILKAQEKNKTQVTFEFHGDMKGWMPVWLMNLIQKKWPLRFIQGMRKELAKSVVL